MEVGNDDRISSRNQADDYRLRGVELEPLGYLMCLVNTYEETVSSSERTALEKASDGDMLDEERKGAGRKTNLRCHYLEPHPQRGVRSRVVRSAGHNTLPSIVGPFFPRPVLDGVGCNDEFLATMLLLLKPWREPKDVKQSEQSWQEAFDEFMASASRRERDVVAGVKYFYQCSDSAGKM